jgi:hypothetical protein
VGVRLKTVNQPDILQVTSAAALRQLLDQHLDVAVQFLVLVTFGKPQALNTMFVALADAFPSHFDGVLTGERAKRRRIRQVFIEMSLPFFTSHEYLLVLFPRFGCSARPFARGAFRKAAFPRIHRATGRD